jgi:hypothetical protein
MICSASSTTRRRHDHNLTNNYLFSNRTVGYELLAVVLCPKALGNWGDKWEARVRFPRFHLRNTRCVWQ